MAEQMRCELVSWLKVERLCQRLAGLVRDSGYRPDLVVAIGRGGYVPARLVCDYLHLMAMTGIKVEHYLSGAQRRENTVVRYPLNTDISGLKVLLVDDVNESGDTLFVASQHLQSFAPAEIRTAVMQDKTVSSFSVDYYAQKIIRWRWLVYPWAVYEDVSGFLQRMDPPPASLDDARQRLEERFNINISRQRLHAIYASLDELPGPPA